MKESEVCIHENIGKGIINNSTENESESELQNLRDVIEIEK